MARTEPDSSPVETDDLRPDCVVCGSTGPFAGHYRRGAFTMVRCVRCGLLFQRPQPGPDVLDAAYYFDPDFSEMLMTSLRDWTMSQATERSRLLSDAVPDLTPGRLLDVGCSSGAWLEVAAGSGWEATGVEIGPTTSADARRRGLDVRTGTLAEAANRLEPGSFDLITFWDVLEHVRRPATELALARTLLRPGGHLALTFPNAAGLLPRMTYRLTARPFGAWEYPELPVHLWDFSTTTAPRLLAHHGFRPVATRTYNSPWSWFAENTASPMAMGGGRRGRLLSAAVGVLARATYPVAARLDRGNGVLVVGRSD